jgi:hypothetical protein
MPFFVVGVLPMFEASVLKDNGYIPIENYVKCELFWAQMGQLNCPNKVTVQISTNPCLNCPPSRKGSRDIVTWGQVKLQSCRVTWGQVKLQSCRLRLPLN